MKKLLKTRWKERDIQLQHKFLGVINKMNARGMLHSSVMVQEMYEVARKEFVESRQIIVSTIIDSLVEGGVKNNKDELINFAIGSLEERGRFIDGQFRERAKISGTLNSIMLEGHIDFSSKVEGAISELKIEIIRALDEYQNKNNDNLKDKILHKLLDIPFVAWLAIVVLVLAAMVSLITDIVELIKEISQ